MKRYYVAYGSNLNKKQMHRRCKDAREVGTAMLENYRLLFKRSKTGSYLTVEESRGSRVPVAVWSVSAKDEEQLDRYEGYPDFYYKKELVLPVKRFETGQVEQLKTFIYIMHEERLIGAPSARYMQTCHEGYDDFGFDHDILTAACINCGGTDIR